MTENINNADAQRDIEAAGQRMRAAIDALVRHHSILNHEPALIDELRAAAADLYDGGIDYAMSVKQSTKTLDDVWESVERLASHFEAKPTDIPLHTLDEQVLDQPGVRELFQDDTAEPDEVPPTNWGARITFADGSGYDIDNIDGVQVHDKARNTFPFGFIEQPNPDGSASGEWRAGYWSPEDGAYRPFDPIAQPNPNNGW